MWYKNLLRTDNGLKPQLVRVAEEIDKGIKHRRDIANPSHGMPLFPLGRLVAYFYSLLPYVLCKHNDVTMGCFSLRPVISVRSSSGLVLDYFLNRASNLSLGILFISIFSRTHSM
jgi:hypothetical protein